MITVILKVVQKLPRLMLNKIHDPKSDRYFSIACNRYRGLLTSFHYKTDIETESPSHLRWMLNEIQFNSEMSITKKHRWLGYVQGIMCSKGILTVESERPATRHIFNGD